MKRDRTSGTGGEYPRLHYLKNPFKQTGKERYQYGRNKIRIFVSPFSFLPPQPFYSHGSDVKKGERNVTSGGPLNCQKAGGETDGGVNATGRTGATWQKKKTKEGRIMFERERNRCAVCAEKDLGFLVTTSECKYNMSPRTHMYCPGSLCLCGWGLKSRNM